VVYTTKARTMKILNNTVLRILADHDIIKTMASGRRLIKNGAIKVDGVKIKENVSIEGAKIISVGKKEINLTH